MSTKTRRITKTRHVLLYPSSALQTHFGRLPFTTSPQNHKLLLLLTLPPPPQQQQKPPPPPFYSPPPSPVMTDCWLRHKLPIIVKFCLLSVKYSFSSFPCHFFLLHWLTMQMCIIFCTSSSLNFDQTLTAVFCGFSQSMAILLYTGSNSLFVASIATGRY